MPTYNNDVIEINHKTSKNDKPYIEIITMGRDQKKHKTLTYDPKLIKEFAGPGLYSMTSETFEGEQYPTLVGVKLISCQAAPGARESQKSDQDLKNREIRAAVILKATAEYCSATKSLDTASLVFETFAALLEGYLKNG